jgi:protein TonB
METAPRIVVGSAVRRSTAPFAPLKDDRGTVKGLAASLIVHALLIGVGGWFWVRPVTYGVAAGPSAVEVELIAAPVMPAGVVDTALAEPAVEQPVDKPVFEPPVETEVLQEPEPLPASAPVETPVRPELTETPRPELKPFMGPAGDGSSPVPGTDATTQSASAGAQVQARPNYLRNPAPRYPEASRKNGEEGLVLLTVEVSASGRPMSVTLAQSSGHERLDRAALEAVRRWAFEPARLGPLPVDSTVQVPVRFRLSDRG